MRTRIAPGALALALFFGSVGCGKEAPPPPSAAAEGPPTIAEKPENPAPTVEEALAFLQRTEAELLRLWIARERTDWVKSTHITHDTELLAAAAEERVMAFAGEAAAEAQRYAGLPLPEDATRKLGLLRTTQTLPSPADPEQRAELAQVATALGSHYGKAKVCIAEDEKSTLPAGCHTLGELSSRLAKSENEAEQREIWLRWRETAASQREPFARYVALGNAGAKAMGFADLGALWRSGYDMAPDAFAAELERLWQQVLPLYRELHCFARARLHARYPEKMPPTGPIPAHLLGNMWAQDWLWRLPLLLPEPENSEKPEHPGEKPRTLTDVLLDKHTTPEQMVRHGEAFFVSLGLPPLPETFWQRSMLQRPADREVECHASAWDVDWQDDLRIKMCVEITDEDFVTVHHELGHNYYQRAYKAQPPLFADSANDGFHEALGDTIALSVTPAYLEKIGLSPGGERSELNFLMQRAAEKVAFLPFGLLVDRWRWQVFSGETPKAQWNEAWWRLREQVQGVAAPEARDESHFDPAGKYHVAAGVPYARYFLAHILQFQFHRALCKAAGHQGPLHLCSIHGSKAAGDKLAAMMAMGQSKPWPEALFAATGERDMDASALVDYFAPLYDWLKKENAGRQCGW
ncbi:MAG: M2 family metallopeptidase [Deltaproteobacteria bacterium]|nr:M2 family metallopeptidase [Deltaproteobacteria bacterium]